MGARTLNFGDSVFLYTGSRDIILSCFQYGVGGHFEKHAIEILSRHFWGMHGGYSSNRFILSNQMVSEHGWKSCFICFCGTFGSSCITFSGFQNGVGGHLVFEGTFFGSQYLHFPKMKVLRAPVV